MIEFLQDVFFANWGKLLWALTFLAFIPAYVQARYLWRSRRFLTRINFSINFLEGNTLRFRTLRETDLADAMLNNAHAVRVVMRATRRGAVLLFKDKDEAWTILNTLLNDLSSLSSEGFVARSMGLPTRSETFAIGITCEEGPDLKITKFRVMIVAWKLLAKIDACGDVQFEQPHHYIRLATLKQMWEIARDETLKHNIMIVELSVRA